jgi:hypothetical protein
MFLTVIYCFISLIKFKNLAKGRNFCMAEIIHLFVEDL